MVDDLIVVHEMPHSHASLTRPFLESIFPPPSDPVISILPPRDGVVLRLSFLAEL